MSEETMPDFGDFAPSMDELEGIPIDKEELVGQVFIVRRFVDLTGEYGPYSIIQVELQGTPRTFGAGGTLYKQLHREGVTVPFTASMERKKGELGWYHAFTTAHKPKTEEKEG